MSTHTVKPLSHLCRGSFSGDEQHLVVFDDAHEERSPPRLRKVVAHVVGNHLVGVPDLLLPVVLRIPERGDCWLHAYVDDLRGLRVPVSSSLLARLASEATEHEAALEFEHRVIDLVLNHLSRRGGPRIYYRRATVSLSSIAKSAHTRKGTDKYSGSQDQLLRQPIS